MSGPEVRLAAFDLDETLLDKDKKITAQMAEALGRLMERGIVVALATGRHFRTAAGYTQELGLNGPVICYNGAVVRRAGAEKPDFVSYLHPEVIREMIAFTRERGLYLQLYDQEDRLLVERITSETEADPDYYTTDTVEAGDLTQVREFHSPKMMIYDHDTELIKSLLPELRQRWQGRLHIAQSTPHLAEMMNPGVNKGLALSRLAEQLGLGPEQVLACGDNSNDAEMLRWAGLGCAVANAAPAAKEAADHICRLPREQGVLEALELFVFSRKP